MVVLKHVRKTLWVYQGGVEDAMVRHSTWSLGEGMVFPPSGREGSLSQADKDVL